MPSFTLTGAELRALRESLGISQAELARTIVVTRYAVYKWERRATQSIPRVQYAAVLSALLRLADEQQRYTAVAAQLSGRQATTTAATYQ